MKRADVLPLDGPGLPPGYARDDHAARKDDIDYWAFKAGRACASGRGANLNPFGKFTPQWKRWKAAFDRGFQAQKDQIASHQESQKLRLEGVSCIIQKTVRGHLKRYVVLKKP